MENYIVRLDRAVPIASDRLSGVVEIMNKKENQVFNNFEELMAILRTQPIYSDIKFCMD